MAESVGAVEMIQKQNPALRNKTFHVPRTDRPKSFVMGGTLLSPAGHLTGSASAVGLQMSPDFTGSAFYPDASVFSAKPLPTGVVPFTGGAPPHGVGSGRGRAHLDLFCRRRSPHRSA